MLDLTLFSTLSLKISITQTLLSLKVLEIINRLSTTMEMYLTLYIMYSDAIITGMASQITSLTIVYSIVCLGTDLRKHQSSTSLAFVWGIHRWPVNSPHKGPVTQKCSIWWRHHDRQIRPLLNMKMVFPGMGISIIMIRLSWDCFICIMGIPIW